MGQDAFSKCHPLTNFVFFLGAIGFTVVFQHPMYLAVSCVGGGVYLLLLTGRRGLTTLAGLFPVFVILSALNPLFNLYGEHVLMQVFGRPYTLEALCYGMAIAGMFVAMVLWFGCYSAVLTSDKFLCLFGSLAPALSMLLVMVLRLIPALQRKAGQISDAWKGIGKGVGEAATLRQKAATTMGTLSALTDWALEGSILTADSMRARGYGSARRSSFQIYRITPRDGLLLGLMLLLAALVVLTGDTRATYTPALSIAPPGWGLVAYGLFLGIPSALHGKEALQWRISISRI